jgi:hypothetical protein
MSFNIRHYDIEMIVNTYTDGGIDDVKKIFKKIDSMTFKDKKSNKIYELIVAEKYKKASKVIEKHLKGK